MFYWFYLQHFTRPFLATPQFIILAMPLTISAFTKTPEGEGATLPFVSILRCQCPIHHHWYFKTNNTTSLHDVRGANVQDGAFNYTKPKTESSLEFGDFGFIKTVTPGLMKKQGNGLHKFKISSKQPEVPSTRPSEHNNSSCPSVWNELN